jgi:Lon protease-like protein
MPRRLPLFPLELVAFPGELVPLHIFEPRYRQLLADCLAGDQRFGITAQRDPAPGALGTIAHIRASQPLPDGRSNIVVEGERRFTLRTLLETDTPYLVASVEEFDDTSGTDPATEELDALRDLGEEYREALSVLADSPADPPPWGGDPEAFSFQVAALAELDLGAKERLLAVRSTRERARALLGALPELLASARARAAVHVRARSNGKGHAGGHDIVTGG